MVFVSFSVSSGDTAMSMLPRACVLVSALAFAFAVGWALVW